MSGGDKRSCALLNLLRVRGLDCQVSKLQFSTSTIFSLNIIRVKILDQTSYNKSWVWEKTLDG